MGSHSDYYIKLQGDKQRRIEVGYSYCGQEAEEIS
jgi:hypothetical protein